MIEGEYHGIEEGIPLGLLDCSTRLMDCTLPIRPSYRIVWQTTFTPNRL